MIVAVLKHGGTTTWSSEVWNMSIRTPATWSAHSLSTQPGMSSGHPAFHMFTLVRVLLTSAGARLTGCSSRWGVDVSARVELVFSNLPK